MTHKQIKQLKVEIIKKISSSSLYTKTLFEILLGICDQDGLRRSFCVLNGKDSDQKKM